MEAIWIVAHDCYYETSECSDELWQCQTCKEWFCDVHSHSTDLGECVECCVCELKRLKRERNG